MSERTDALPDLRLSVEDFQQRNEAGEATRVDVRSRLACQRAHLPGALSIPMKEMGPRIKELPRRRSPTFD